MQPTSGMSKVHVRRKRQSMAVVVMVAADRADGYLLDGRKSSINLRWRIMHRARIAAAASTVGRFFSGEVCRLQQPVRRTADAARTHECTRGVCAFICVPLITSGALTERRIRLSQRRPAGWSASQQPDNQSARSIIYHA